MSILSVVGRIPASRMERSADRNPRFSASRGGLRYLASHAYGSFDCLSLGHPFRLLGGRRIAEPGFSGRSFHRQSREKRSWVFPLRRTSSATRPWHPSLRLPTLCLGKALGNRPTCHSGYSLVWHERPCPGARDTYRNFRARVAVLWQFTLAQIAGMES